MTGQLSEQLKPPFHPSDEDRVNQLSVRALWIVFFLLYLPLLYYRGWALPPEVGIDYPSWRLAAQTAFVEGKTPYGLNVFSHRGFAGIIVQPYVYPPPSLLAFWPLAKLSPWAARAAFLTVSHLCLLGSIWVMLFKLVPLSCDRRLRCLTLFLLIVYLVPSSPVSMTFGNGQINFMALLFICIAMAAFRNGSSDWLLAISLSIAIVLKTYPVLLLIPLVFRKRFRAAALTCALFAAITATAFLVLPLDVWRTWLVEVVPLGSYANNKFPAGIAFNQSMNAFIMRLLQETYFSKAPLYYPRLAKPVATGLAFLVIGVTVLFSYRVSKASDPDRSRDDEIAAYLLMTYIIAPLSWEHHLVYIFPATVLAISLLIQNQVRRGVAYFVIASVLLTAWKFPIERLDIIFGWRTLWLSPDLYAVVILWVFFVRRLHLSRRNVQHTSGYPHSAAALRSAEASIA